MSACSLIERMPILNSASPDEARMEFLSGSKRMMSQLTPSHAPLNPGGPGGGGTGDYPEGPATLERDYYGCYCLKFIVKNGTHITEDKVMEEFGHFGDVVDVRGPGLFSGLRGNHVYVRYIDKRDAETALDQLNGKYHQLTPASISDVLPDNYGLYTISFYNKTGIPSSEVRKEFSKFGEVKNLTGSLDVKGGRVFVSYKEKTSAVQALQAFFFRKDRYPNMKFALPRCEKDYFGCYCLKFYNKSGDVTEEKVHRDFGQFGDVVDVRGPGLFDVTGDDVYVRYKEKSSAEQALIELVGKYDSLCLAPPSDIQADKFGYFTITFVNDKCLSKSDVWYIFSKFGTVACVNGTFDCKKGRVFVSYKEKQGALNALETMLITKEYHLQVSKNSTVRKNDYNVVGSGAKDVMETSDFGDFSNNANHRSNGLGMSNSSSVAVMNGSPHPMGHEQGGANSSIKHSASANSVPSVMSGNADEAGFRRDHSRSRETSLVPNIPHLPNASSPSAKDPSSGSSGNLLSSGSQPHHMMEHGLMQMTVGSGQGSPKLLGNSTPLIHPGAGSTNGGNRNGMVKFNRNVEKDIFGYFCLSFLNEDGDINEKKVRHDFGKFGEVVSVRGALGKQKGHVFVRFRKKESAENCLNCLNSFPLSEMSELFGKYLFLSPATPRDIDCDMYGLYSISFLNLNMKTCREIRQEFGKFGEIVRLTSGGGGNTDELVSISYADKVCAVKALQTHFTNKEFPYLDIAKGSSLLLVNSSDSSDNEENDPEYMYKRAPPAVGPYPRTPQGHMSLANRTNASLSGAAHSPSTKPDPFHDPLTVHNGQGGNDVVDELLKPLQSYFQIYQTGQYQHMRGDLSSEVLGGGANSSHLAPGSGNSFNNANSNHHRSPDKKYRIKSVRNGQHSNAPSHGSPHAMSNGTSNKVGHRHHRSHMSSSPPSLGPPRIHSGGKLHNMENPPPSHPPLAGLSEPNTHGEGPKQRSAVVPNENQASTGPEMEGPAALAASTSPSLSPASKSPSGGGSPIASSRASSTQASPERDMRGRNEPTAAARLPNGAATKRDTPEPPTEEDEGKKYQTVARDFLGFFTLSFPNKMKDLTERKVKLDFDKAIHVRGLSKGANSGSNDSSTGSDSLVFVSFAEQAMAEEACNNEHLQSKYTNLACAPSANLAPDRDGHFSVEFVNSAMNGIREITTDFSRHGEVVKVMAGRGTKNSIKRVTVSYAESQSALEAMKSFHMGKDYSSLDFSRECLDLDGDPGTTATHAH